MKNTYYLYNCHPSKFANLQYTKALELKIILAKKLLDELVNVNVYARDEHRINDVLKAIKFNQNLLDELSNK